MLDARRMEVYSIVYNNKFEECRGIRAEVIDENSFSGFSDANVVFLGDGAAKCKEVLKRPNFSFIEGKFPSSVEMAKLSYDKYKKNDIEDVAYFEPFYLKDFIVTPEKKKV